MITNLPQIVTTLGLYFDIVGAWFVAIEVVHVFNSPATIDVGDAGTFNGGTQIVPNPEFQSHEKKKRLYMKWGLALLLIGFGLQIVGTWLPICCATPTSTKAVQVPETKYFTEEMKTKAAAIASGVTVDESTVL